MQEQEPLLLIVDDNEDNRYTLKQRLARDGYRNILQASDGGEALQLLASETIDLVLLDVLMPETDGYQVLQRMRDDTQLRNIPVIMTVIMISAVDEMESVVRCIEAGADDYLPKPFNAMLLRARLRSSLEKKRQRDESLRQLGAVSREIGRYVPERVVEAIVSGQVEPEPVQDDATILYTDIEDFTRIAESMQPRHIVDMLNQYFDALIEPITALGGIVHQFQGDAMLVSFNESTDDRSHADRAVQAAARIQQMLLERRFAGIGLRTRIGITSGQVFAGNVGAGDRLNYTVHGNAVNMAARLEQLNKEFGSSVLISDETVRRLCAAHPIESVGRVPIRGNSHDAEIYRLQAA
jgi:class 3 adenylate cyclase